MKHTLKPYPVYKVINLPWLKDIPEYWKIRRGKFLFRCIDVRSLTGNEELLTVSSDLGVIPRKYAKVTMFKAKSYTGYKLCWPGDLVINSLWAWARGLGISRYHGIVSSAYGVYRLQPKLEADSRYIHNLVRSSPFQWELQVRSKGIWVSRLQLTDEAFLEAPILLPPLPEQNAIVHYLDYIDRKIRRYINAKKKLIVLLNEQKNTIIHQAITRGIEQNIRLKPSGVEWLGDIPEHWEVRRLKTLSRMKSGESITSLSINETGNFPVYGGNGIRGYSSSYTNDGDHVLIGRQGALCGNIHRAKGKFWASEHAVVVYLATGFDIGWYESLLNIMNLNQYSISAAQPGLAVDRILNLFAPVPPLKEEQTHMAKYIEFETTNLVLAISRMKKEIELLKEYHNRLISDIVTGKLDVRQVASSLPEIADEPEVPAIDSEPIDDIEMYNELEVVRE